MSINELIDLKGKLYKIVNYLSLKTDL
jgi:hypothetical protein